MNATADGKEVVTNLYCNPSALTLTAAPPADRSWNNYNFLWYRKVGEGLDKGELISGKTRDTITDDGFSAYAGQKLRYTVEVYQNGCTKALSSRVSNQLFFFEDVPTLSTHIDTTNDIKKASCSTTKDGKLIIRASSTNPALRYYYNIGRLDPEGNVQFTEIHSSGRKAANVDFSFEDLLPGDYKVQVLHGGYDELEEIEYTQKSDMSNAGYCYNEYTINIPYRAPFTLGTSTVTPVTCHGGSDGKITVSYQHREGALTLTLKRNNEVVTSPTYTVDMGASTLTISELLAGEYTCTINDSRGCASPPTGNAIITQPEALNFTTTVSNYNTADISCHGAADAFIEVTATGGNWANAYSATLHKDGALHQPAVSFVGTTTFTDLAPGKYTVTVETTGGCAFSKTLPESITITEPEPLTISSSGILPITCYGVPNGEITVASEGGTGLRQFRIDGGDWQTAVDVEDEDLIVGLDSGWHTVEVKDINGCVASEPFKFRLTYPTPLAAQLVDSIMPLCHGGSDGKLFFHPSGGDPITQAYQISLQSVERPFEEPRVSTTYSAVDPTQLPIIFNKLRSGHYIVTVTDPTKSRYACSRVVDTVFLPQPTAITVETVVINQPSCAGATDGSVHVKAHSGTPGTDPDYYYSVDGINYTAPNEAGVAIFTGLGTGSYTFYAVDGHHEDHSTPAFLDGDSRNQLCTGSLNFTLDEPDLINVITTTQSVVCYGTATGSITVDAVTGGRGDYTYAWEALDTEIYTPSGYRSFTPTNPLHPTDLAYGTYRLTVRDAAGCQAVVVTEVTQSTIPLAIDAVQTYAESCTGTADGKLQILAKGGYPPYTYRVDSQADQFYGLFEGLTTGAYLLTVRDQRGCEVKQLVDLAADDLIVEIADQIPATIGAENGLIRLRTTGGTNKDYYINGLLSTTGSEFSNLPAGQHTVAIEYNGQCRWEQTFTINEVEATPPALQVTTEALQNVSCADAQDGSVRVAVRGGIPPYALQWDDLPGQNNAELTNLSKATYTLMVTDAAGVTLDYPITIDGPEPLEIISAVAISPTCYQGRDGYAEVSVVGGTAPYTYAWSRDAQQNTARASGLSAGTYSVTITDQQGCSQFRELTIAATSAPDDLLEPQAITLCTGQSVTVDAGAGSAHAWTSDNGFISAESRVAINQAGRYFLQVTTDKGCVVYDTLDLITTDNVIDAEFLIPTEILAGDTVVLTEVSWPAPEQTVWQYDERVTTYQSDEGKEYIVFPTPGEYTITLTVIIGNCLDQVEKKIIVSDASVTDPSAENGRLGYQSETEYLLYPNPNNGRFTLKISLPETQPVRVSVYDPLFTYRYFQKQFFDTQTIEEAVDLTHLKLGVYALIVETPAEVKIIRFVIR